MRTSITYRAPGGLSITYRGAPKSGARWFLGTWRGGLAFWRMWFRAGRELRGFLGRRPTPQEVSRYAGTRIAGTINDALKRAGQ